MKHPIGPYCQKIPESKFCTPTKKTYNPKTIILDAVF